MCNRTKTPVSSSAAGSRTIRACSRCGLYPFCHSVGGGCYPTDVLHQGQLLLDDEDNNISLDRQNNIQGETQDASPNIPSTRSTSHLLRRDAGSSNRPHHTTVIVGGDESTSLAGNSDVKDGQPLFAPYSPSALEGEIDGSSPRAVASLVRPRTADEELEEACP